MSDNDLIRRKDALAAVQGFEYGWHAEDVIAALPAALSRCPYGASGDDCCGGYCSMDDDKKGGDACDKDDDPTNARPATSPGVTTGADAAHARETALQELIDAYEHIMDYGIVFATKAQQDRLKAAKARL